MPLSEFRNQTGDYTYHLGYMGADQENKQNKVPFIIVLRPKDSNDKTDLYYTFDYRRKITTLLEKLQNEPNLDLKTLINNDINQPWLIDKIDKSANLEIYSYKNQNNQDKKEILSFVFRGNLTSGGGIAFNVNRLKFDAIPDKLENKWVIKQNVKPNPSMHYPSFWIPKNLKYSTKYITGMVGRDRQLVNWIEIEFKKPIKNNIPNNGLGEK